MKHRTLLLLFAFAASLLPAAEIHDAASGGDTAKVVELLKAAPALVSEQDLKTGDLPLHLAAAKGWLEIIVALLDAGADVNAKGNHGWTPLHYAATGGSIGACRLLMQRGADRSALNGDQKTPLQVGGLFTAPVLRDFIPSATGADELFRAIAAGDEEKAKTLIAAHPDTIKAKDERGCTPLLLAAKAGRTEIVSILLKNGASVSAKDKTGETALHWAATADSTDTTHALIAAGANVNAQDDSGFTPLASAVELRNNAQVAALLSHGAKLEVAIPFGQTPLLMAASYGYADTVQLLLKAGAKTDALTQGGIGAIHQAALAGSSLEEHAQFKKGEPGEYAAIVKLLLEAGVPVDMVDRKDGWTALHAAAMGGAVDAARVLLDKGARLNATGKDGRTALHLAARQGTPEMIALLLDRGAPIDPVQANHPSKATPLMKAEEGGKLENVKLLLKRGANLQVRGFPNRVSVLHSAAWHNHVEIAKVLLAAGIDVDVRDADKGTPLMVAVSMGSREAAALLIEKGADLNVRFLSGDTLLKAATDKGHTAIVSLLKAHGAKK